MNQELENIVTGEHYSAEKVKDFILHVHTADPPEIDIYHLLKVASPEEKEVVFSVLHEVASDKCVCIQGDLVPFVQKIREQRARAKKQH
ncbi:MAG: hypothetical protein IBX45_11835 [Campylobacterales bacterium]|nr:hypothetical protein [Campylobacterales bacterium]